MALIDLLKNLPEVRAPTEKKVSFNVKLKWTLIILVAFFILSNITLVGITESAHSRFDYLSTFLGASFGSLMTLGIGPIVMASIILQLLVGAQIINIDTSTAEGKKFFQGLQKLLAFAFVLFEAMVYVLMNAVEAQPGFASLVIFQLCLGGILIIFMDEVIQKWGFGSGVSLFIAAGIGSQLFVQLFQFINPTTLTFEATGRVLAFFASIVIADGNGAMRALVPIITTVLLFLAVVFAQSLKVEIPLAFDRIRGHSVKWPLQFFYAGVMPVIFVSALVANIQLFGSLLQNWLGHPTFIGGFSGATPVSGLAFWIGSTPIVLELVAGSFRWVYALQGLIHVLFYMGLAILFSFFWVNTAGMDARSQASKIMNSGMSMPGFRKDERVMESILKRYVNPLTIMGGAAIGLLASIANLLGALVGGTAILLAIMVIYQLYENIAQQHAVDMNPALRGFFGN